jgi:putative membrane protein
MIRLVLTVVMHVLACAIGLVVAAAILDDMALDLSGFLIAVGIFAAVDLVAQPLIIKIGWRHAQALTGSSALLSTFVALVVTTIVSDGLRITGVGTWLLATVIVWAATLVAAVLLPITLFKRWLGQRQSPSGRPPVQTFP